ncbi:DUF2185 domain-containing protein [Pedobacter frigoris]|uniref:immunity protein Imm33 domain-containing protein n=1 Tax=Pedobacter frigoris TaxID=2571272 RepID=UPI00292FF951|nr:DUF2185 domain-containing protein [Pedobacter frigoris]
MPSWKLEDANEIRKEAPYTFYKPSDHIIDHLIPGASIVKLIFSFDSVDPEAPSAERMWVTIDSAENNGIYTGVLDNEPLYIQDLKLGDTITFGKENIIDYDTLDELDIEDPLGEMIEKYNKRCFVSNHIIKDGYKVGRLFKEDGDYENYSGWTLMSDHESQDYVDDPVNLQYISLGTILNIDDSFIHLLDEPMDSEFARDNVTGDYFSI